MATKPMKNDFYQDITNQVIEALEQGVKPWSCPWDVTHASGIPCNYQSQTEYKGLNIMLLWMSAQLNRFSSNKWLTYKQSKALGGQVRKGEKGTAIFFFKIVEKKNRHENDNDEQDTYAMLRTFKVFNVDQIDGIEDDEVAMARPERDEIALIDEAERFIQQPWVSIRYGGQKAFYRPSTDDVVIPDRERFVSTADLYATIMHELTHWTGHQSRLDRDSKGRFGSKDYAFEELIAELGAAFTMADLGIVGDVQHESYIANWLEALKNDKRYVFKAAAQASKAHQYLMSLNEMKISKAA